MSHALMHFAGGGATRAAEAGASAAAGAAPATGAATATDAAGAGAAEAKAPKPSKAAGAAATVGAGVAASGESNVAGNAGAGLAAAAAVKSPNDAGGALALSKAVHDESTNEPSPMELANGSALPPPPPKLAQPAGVEPLVAGAGAGSERSNPSKSTLPVGGRGAVRTAAMRGGLVRDGLAVR